MHEHRIRGNIDFLNRDARVECDSMDRGFHLIAKVAAGLAVKSQAQLRAISSAAFRGSAAATIGRPTTT
jgi:hypothetical protein